ncbi:MAG: polyketide synthase dehydratase domain-containing protein [Legionella sp.]|nr:polyketide synthase dehydratase domain-containing protein [Legionella sp.]
MSIDTDAYENELIKKSILEIRKLKRELLDIRSKKTEPIAIIGIGCTLPGGVSSPEELWKFISDKGDGIREPIKQRWDLTNIAKVDYHKNFFKGGFISKDFSKFDPMFFGIPPKEANYLDPQHRLFLEDSWKALINAGLDPKNISGSNTGVFCGITSNEYLHIMLSELREEELNPYITSGNCLNFAAGRVSYILGVHGPSLAVDAACSSSLVAIHMAVQSLRAQECDMAIAGGVSLMLMPQTFLLLKNGNMLSPDGRCKTFDDSANGYARGEGSGVVILKRLSDAVHDGDRIYATIKNILVKHDGKKSGLTVPTSASQKMLFQETLLGTDVRAQDISYSEAHGTGTFLGDPIELESLNAVYGKGRSKNESLNISSIKSNFGHLEAAAGVAGLIKVALSIYNKKIPAHFSLDRLNSNFDWENSNLNVVTDILDWPENKKMIATVSAFGASGINAHAILEDAQVPMREDFLARTQTIAAPIFKKITCWYKSFEHSESKAISNKDLFKKDYPFINATYLISLDIDSVPTIREHRIFDTIVLTGSIYLDIALTIAKELLGEKYLQQFSFGNVTLLKPILFQEQCVDLRVTFEMLDFINQNVAYRIKIGPQVDDDKDSLYGSIDIQKNDGLPLKLTCDYIDKCIGDSKEICNKHDFYNNFWGKTFTLGEPFHLFDKIWRNDGMMAVGLCRPKDFLNRTNGYGLNPESLLAYLTGLLFKAALPYNKIVEMNLQDKAVIGSGYDSCVFYESLVKDELYVVAEIKKRSDDGYHYNGDVIMLDLEGNVLCKMVNIAFQAIARNSIPQISSPPKNANLAGKHVGVHPILGDTFSKIKDWTLSTELEYESYPLIGDHLTFDYALFPALGYIDLAIKAIKKLDPEYIFTMIEDLKIAQPIMLHKGDKYKIKTWVDKLSAQDYVYNIHAYSAKKNIINKEWGLSSSAKVTNLTQIPEKALTFDPEIVKTYPIKYSTKEFFNLFWNDDFILGNSYQFMENIWRKEFEAIGVIRNFENYKKRIGISELTGSFLQIYMSLPLAMAAIPNQYIEKAKKEEATCIATSVKRFVIYNDGGLEQYKELWAHVQLADKESLDDKWITDFKYYNEKGILVAKVDGVEFHIMKKEALELLKTSMENFEISKSDKPTDVFAFLKAEISEIVGIDVAHLNDDVHLGELMDSIMALHLRVRIEKNLAILLPLSIIAQTKSVNQLVSEIMMRSGGI